MNDFLKFYEQLQGEWKKRVKPHKCLGLALSEEHLVAAEVHRRKEGFTIGKKAVFAFSEDVSLDRPQRLGEALKQFLKEGGFTARKVSVGIPAKWAMTREVTLPPSPGYAISGALKIHAEREFSLSPEDLVLDYTGVIRSDGPSRLVLSAMLKKRMHQIQEVVQGAGLEVLSISVSSAALFELAGRNGTMASRPRFALFMQPAHSELLVSTGEQTVDVKYFQKRMEAGEDVSASEINRVLSSCMKSFSGGDEEKILLWNGSENPAEEIAAALPVQMAPQGFDVREILEKSGLATGVEKVDLFGPSFSLALRIFSEQSPSVADFLNSRMEAKAGRIEKRHVRMAVIVACAALVFMGGMIFSWEKNVKDVARLKEKLAGMKVDIDAARNIVEKVSATGKWYGDRPQVLECLRALTLIFPEEGRIWSTSLALNEEMSGVLSGKATDEQSVIEVMDKMKKSPEFSNVQMIYMRSGGKDSQEISFSMSFVFNRS